MCLCLCIAAFDRDSERQVGRKHSKQIAASLATLATLTTLAAAEVLRLFLSYYSMGVYLRCVTVTVTATVAQLLCLGHTAGHSHSVAKVPQKAKQICNNL